MTVRIENRPIKGILLDLDGCMYDHALLPLIFENSRQQIIQFFLDKQGITNSTPEQQLSTRTAFLKMAHACGSFSQAFINFGANLGISTSLQEYQDVAEHTDKAQFLSPNPELKQLLEQLHPHVKLGILTSSTEASIDNVCNKLLGPDWRDLFDAVVGCDTSGLPAEKPAPESFIFAAGMLGLTEKDVAMFGDTADADLYPAKKLGMLAIPVSCPTFPSTIHLASLTDLAQHVTPLTPPPVLAC
jgi:FMN phosphatase YigB (HAD superfamily)